MAKILTDIELLTILSRAITDHGEIDEADTYKHFLEDLADVVTEYFGGTLGTVAFDDDEGTWFIAIHGDENVPENGGIYRDFDPDGELFDEAGENTE